MIEVQSKGKQVIPGETVSHANYLVASIVAAMMMVMMEQKTLVENVGEREV